MKRLLTNQIAFPQGVPVWNVLLNRLILDRDTRDRASWVTAPAGTEGKKATQLWNPPNQTASNHPWAPDPETTKQPLHCYWHPAVETGLSCGRCGKAICTGCMVQAPVGIRCRDCGIAAPIPTFDVTPTYYARAVGAGGGVCHWGRTAVVYGEHYLRPHPVLALIGGNSP